MGKKLVELVLMLVLLIHLLGFLTWEVASHYRLTMELIRVLS